MKSAYELGQRKVIPATLIYVFRSEKILMLHRATGKDAGAVRRWNGLGGKLEPEESPLEGARRELAEESCLSLPDEAFQSLGILQFPNFKATKGEDWLCFVYAVDCPESEALKVPVGVQGSEGCLEWVTISKVLDLELWEGDRTFLPWVFKRKPFLATLWYRDGRVNRIWGPVEF